MDRFDSISEIKELRHRKELDPATWSDDVKIMDCGRDIACSQEDDRMQVLVDNWSPYSVGDGIWRKTMPWLLPWPGLKGCFSLLLNI